MVIPILGTQLTAGRIDRPETFKLPTPGPDPKEQESKEQKK